MAFIRSVPRWTGILSLLALLTIYGLTSPGDRFESIDGYDYAQAAEIVPLALTYDSRSILFHKLNRLLFVAAQSAGLPLDAHTLIRWLSTLAALASLALFVRLAVMGFGLSRRTALQSAAILAVSYGFWRYAVEVEVYLPSIAIILATFCLLFEALARPQASTPLFLAAGTLGGMGCLYYQGNAVALCLAAPVLLLGRGRLGGLLAYATAGSVVSAAGVIAAYLASETAPLSFSSLYAFLSMRFTEFQTGRSLAVTIVGSAMAILHDVVSLNWLYAIDLFHTVFARWLPGSFARLEGVGHAAMRFKPFVYAALLLLPLIAAIIVDALFTAIRSRQWPPLSRAHALLAVWLGGSLLVNGHLGPAEPEVWITMLPALVLGFAILVVEPVAGTRSGQRLWVLPALMLAHKFFGGIGMFQQSDGLHAARTSWLARQLRPADVVLVDKGDQRLWSYLRYRLGATLLYSDGETAGVSALDERFRPEQGPLDAMLEKVTRRGGRIFTLGDAAEPSRRIARAAGEAEYRQALRLAERLRGRTHLVDAAGPVPIYEVRP